MNTKPPAEDPKLKADREAITAALNELQKTYDSRVLFFACLVRAELLGRRLILHGVETPKSITRDFALACNDAISVDGVEMPRLERQNTH